MLTIIYRREGERGREGERLAQLVEHGINTVMVCGWSPTVASHAQNIFPLTVQSEVLDKRTQSALYWPEEGE